MDTFLRDVRSAEWSADAGSAVLLLHGFGSHEHDLPGLVPALDLTVPWASLRAPFGLDNGGAAWFDFTASMQADSRTAAAATDAIWAWVDANLDPAARIIPIGFSQGGAMATQLLRTRPERVVAPVVLAGFVLDTPQPGDESLEVDRPALFWGRGSIDQVISPAAVELTREWLSSHATVTARVYSGLAHGVNAAEAADVRSFLAMHASAS